MELITSLAMNIPMVLASVAFLIAALLKAGKEKGAALILVGAIGICVLSIANPVLHQIIMPTVIQNSDPESIHRVYMVVGFFTALAWAGAFALIAIGTFLRPPAVSRA